MLIKEIIQEGIHDPGIFKAVFFIGGPGSGKSYIGNLLSLKSMGLVNIDSDVLFAILMKKANLDLKMPPEQEPERNVVRSRAKKLTTNKRNLAIDGRLGIQVQSTGYDFDKMNALKEKLEDIGYETALVVVDTDLGTAQARNVARGEAGDRAVDPRLVAEKWHLCQANLKSFLQAFPRHFVINNSPTNRNLQQDVDKTHKALMVWTRQVPNNPAAQEWMQSQK